MFPNYSWIFLIIVVFIAVFVDLGVSLRNSKKISVKSAIHLSILWIALAVSVGVLIYLHAGIDMAVEYITAYSIELSLSIDNVFVFILIFKYFNIEDKHQHKVLFIGVLSAVIFRFIMITFGIYVIHMFEWIFLPFGLLLMYSGYKLPLMGGAKSNSFDNNMILKFVKKHFNYSDNSKNGELFFRKDNKFFITPLALSLLVIEKADIIFALDSVPAVLAITKEPFIAFSSNILAILGLRSMYFVMSNAVQDYRYLKHGVGYMLIYVGLKMVLSFFGIHFSNYISILIIILFIFCSIMLSIIKKPVIRQ
ncbi:TerC/Alx family metal homeostasis membrane protein [Candidatus Bandiella numerosa]|uniref:TerC/Alx family metal homeostasis membrane protein n=1 Tax=Candidatus Bandiella numerosa TaxID=2570586 RepID=UPI001EFF6029|nr:TerC/Alx family metal homeostasis membrane protein [Candidatus Bandiella numerosa]